MEEERDSPGVNGKPLNDYSIDLLHNFHSGFDLGKESPADESKDIQLNLGLSLGGRFGVDPCEKRLVRSSSIVGIEILQGVNDGLSSAASPSIGSMLMRACSLPTAVEEEPRKRKELQLLRRMELKRRRTEKQRNARAARRALVEKNSEEDMTAQDEGLSSCVEVGSLMISQSWPKHTEQKPVAVAPTKLASTANVWESPSNNLSVDDGLVVEKGGNVMEAMPRVSTRVEGPSGKKIEGFLYKYRDGEEVRIVCVCHGRFLSPAEFVKHGGGGDVAHPLRHIVVNRSSSSFF